MSSNFYPKIMQNDIKKIIYNKTMYVHSNKFSQALKILLQHCWWHLDGLPNPKTNTFKKKKINRI